VSQRSKQKRSRELTSETDLAYTQRLQQGCQFLKMGNFNAALRRFSSISRITRFSLRDVAQLYEAQTLHLMGQHRRAYQMVKQITKQYRAQTVYRATALGLKAEISMSLGMFMGLDEVLEEAAQIFQEQRLTSRHAYIVSLQSDVAAWRGEAQIFTKNEVWAGVHSGIDISEIELPSFAAITPEDIISSSRSLVTVGAQS